MVPIIFATRVLLFLFVFVVLHITPRGDVPIYYYPQALSVLAGLRPYRDFITSYAPLHSYLDAAVILFWRSPLAIVFLAIVAEFIVLLLWASATRSGIPYGTMQKALLLYAVSPLSIMFVSVDGQNNVLAALFLALSVWFALKDRPVVSGIMSGLAVCAVKFLSLLYLPAFLITLRRWRIWVLGVAAIILATYGPLVALHWPVLEPFVGEGARRESGCLPFLIESLSGMEFNGRLWDLLLLLALGAVFLIMAVSLRRRDPGQMSVPNRVQLYILVYGMVAITFTLLLFSKKSWASYTLLALFPICLVIAEGKQRLVLIFAGFQWIAVIEHSFWFVLGNPEAQEYHRLLLSRDVRAEALLGIEVLLIAGYITILSFTLRGLRRQQWLDLDDRDDRISPTAV